MEKLNELVEQAKAACDGRAVGYMEKVNPQTILAIAAAFRELEQLKEQYLNNWSKAEKECSSLEMKCVELEQRAEAAEKERDRRIADYKHLIDQHMPRTIDGCDEGWSRVIEAHELQTKLEAAEAKLQAVTESRDQWEANAHEFSRCADRLEAKLAELERKYADR